LGTIYGGFNATIDPINTKKPRWRSQKHNRGEEKKKSLSKQIESVAAVALFARENVMLKLFMTTDRALSICIKPTLIRFKAF
jgi:hypothetical protein